MKFLLDQSVDARLVEFLKSEKHDVVRIGKDYPHGLSDKEVLKTAYTENRILIADDRDFGELIFRLEQPHAGVIYFKLGNYATLEMRTKRLEYVLGKYADKMDQFFVVSPDNVRLRSNAKAKKAKK